MKYILIFFLLFASPALAANVNIDALPAAASVGGTDLLECEQVGVNRKCTAAQTAAYVNSLFSADATVAAGGAITFATVNSNIGSFGSTTQCTSITVNAKGLITAASQATCAPAFTSVTGRATLAQLPQGLANSIWINPTGSTADMQNVAVPACANDGVHALVYVNGSGLACSALTTGGAGTVTNIATSCGVSGGPITTTGTLSGTALSAIQTGTNYAFVTGDCGSIVYLNNASNQIPTIAQAGTTGFAAGWFVEACNIGAGTQTITPTTSTIGGAATYILAAGTAAAPKCIGINSDGTNYKLDLTGPVGTDASAFTSGTLPAARGGAGAISGALKGNGSGVVSQAACADLSNGTALCSTTPGTGVATAAAANLSAAGGLTSTIASGTVALGTSAIGSAACATVVTVTATNVATTDVLGVSFNGDPTAVTGYVPLTSGMLVIIPYPTSGNVNFKVCNNTGGSITPGAITLNWRVAR